jgi:hypothetical protein
VSSACACAGAQFVQHFAALLRLRLAGGQLRGGAGQFQLQQRRTGRDLLAFAHVDAGDFFRRRRRQGDAIPFQRAQRMRRLVAAAGQQQGQGGHREAAAQFSVHR